MLRAISITRKPAVKNELVVDTLTLPYGARTVQSSVVQADKGLSFLIDLAKETTLKGEDALKLEGGKLVQIIAADEPLLEVTVETPLRLLKAAWVLGGLNVPVSFEENRLFIPDDEELAETMRGMGCSTKSFMAPFNPEKLSLGCSCGCGGHHHDHEHDGHHHHGHDHSHGHHHHEHDHNHSHYAHHHDAHSDEKSGGKCCGHNHDHTHS